MFVAAIAAFPVFALTDSSQESEAADTEMLVDYGNGWTEWIPMIKGDTIKQTVADSLRSASISHSDDLTMIGDQSPRVVGAESTGGSLTEPGATGVTVECGWKPFMWDGTEWTLTTLNAMHSDGIIAIAYYPDGIIPVETPEYKSSWTAIQGDSWNSANQTADVETSESGIVWSIMPKYNGPDPSGLYGGVLAVRGDAILKFGNASSTTGNTAVISYDTATGEENWSFYFKPNMMDTTSALIIGQYLYVGSNNGHIYRINWMEGPGDKYQDVITIGGAKWDDPNAIIPKYTIDIDWYVSYQSTITSMVADSGAIYLKAYNGMTYCFDLDLNLIWSYQMEGRCYYSTPTVFDGMVFSGCYDGTLYVFDQCTGELLGKQIIYQTTDFKGKCGAANVAQVFKDGDSDYTVFLSCSDGLGMDSKYSSLVVYKFNGSKFTLIKDFKTSLGGTGTYLTRYETDSFKGILVGFNSGIYYVDEAGNATLVSDFLSGLDVIHNAPLLVNGHIIYGTTYSTWKTASIDLDNGRVGQETGLTTNSMISPVVVDGYSLAADDTGMVVYYSTYTEFSPPVPVPTDDGVWKPIMYILIGLVIFLVALWAILRFGFKWEHPFEEIRNRVMHFFFGAEYTHNKRSKRKVRAVVLFGIAITLIVSLVSLCVGPETTMGLGEAISNTISSIQKGGHNLTYEEMLIYNQRLPRVLAAVGVGVGLSVAGAMYQAVIKNPLVEPYIMGVSSGAGTFAVAVLTFDFTFFGLFASGSIYLTAFAAMFGGLLAFGLTMLLALKTGGKSINYVLAGIVIGLVFSAVQSLLMINAGTKVASALSWLYGSFSTMTWDKVWLVLIPALFLSMIPLVWAKEFNLVLLGEDQAKQMGLNAKRFDAVMLIFASVLTSFCVAFCGVIGFVGLVIPHLSRMILGGDHRLMLPATMAFGGFLMVSADLLARVLLSGYELPVGAITTVIGVPVFAYLLIKRGRSYDV
jgi:iron complex transport system permease protein